MIVNCPRRIHSSKVFLAYYSGHNYSLISSMRALGISVFYTAWLTGLAVSLPLRYSSHNILPAGRDLLGLLGDVESGYTTAGPTDTLGSSVETTGIDILTALGKISSSTTSPLAFVTINSGIQSISTNEKGESATTTLKASASKSSSSVPALATHATVPYNIGDTSEAPTTPPGELTEWKVIGIAVITITFIATVVLLVSFFDSWWGFVRAAMCGKSRKGNMSTRGLAGETLVPDWEKRSWEFRLANEDGHRYPTMTSLESIVKEKEEVDEPGWGEHDIKSPEMAYGGI